MTSSQEKLNSTLSRILQVTVDSTIKKEGVVFLPGLAQELSSGLDMSHIDDVLIERLSMSDCKDLRSQLMLLMSFVDRIDREVGSGALSSEVREMCMNLTPVLERYISTCIQCPELFNHSGRSFTRSGEIVASMAMSSDLPISKIIRICDVFVSEVGENELSSKELYSPLLLTLVNRIVSTRSFDVCGDQATSEVNMLSLALKLSKHGLLLGKILTHSVSFMPPLSEIPPPMKMPTAPGSSASSSSPTGKNVFIVQMGSWMGRLLMPSTVDHVLMGAIPENPASSSSGSTCAKKMYFSNLSRRTWPDLNASVTQVRSLLNNSMDSVLSIVQPLIRSSEETRMSVLKWFAFCMKHSATRATMGWQHQAAPHGANLAEHLSSTPQLNSSLERFRMLTNMQFVRFSGSLSSGCCLNLAWIMLELCKPIKLYSSPGSSNFTAMDSLFMLSSDPSIVELQSALAEETRLGGSSDKINEIRRKFFACNNVPPSISSFKTQIFWLAVNAIHVLILPSCKEAEMALQVASVFSRDKKEIPASDAFGEFHCFEAVLNNPRFVDGLAHLINLLLAMVVSHVGGGSGKLDIRAEKSTDEMSDSLAVIPACIMDELVELLEFYKTMADVTSNGGKNASSAKLMDLIDADIFLMFCIWMLGSDTIKNPNIRGKAAKILLALSKEPRFSSRLINDQVSVRNMVPACVRVFSAVEKTKQSYYDIRMHVKFELRIPIQQLFELLLNHESHRSSLKSFVREFRDEFYKFASQLLNDTTYLIEEGMDTLIAVRKKEKEDEAASGADPAGSGGHAGGPTESSGTAGLGVDRTVEQDDQNEEGQDMYRRSRHDPKEHCRQYMRMGHQTMNTLHQMCKQTCDVLVDDQVVLEQMIHSCLDPSLDRLVGPKCLELKGQRSKFDFALFEFDPKKLLYQIVEMYVYLVKGAESVAQIARIMAEDSRYFRPDTLRKAIAIAKREHLVAGETLRDFELLVKCANEFATQAKNALDSVEVPDEFMDPIMAEIMVDPVLLPTSHNVMDRRHIMRIIMADDHDPFNRQPLRPQDLVPQTDLRKRIHEFCATHGIPIDMGESE